MPQYDGTNQYVEAGIDFLNLLEFKLVKNYGDGTYYSKIFADGKVDHDQALSSFKAKQDYKITGTEQYETVSFHHLDGDQDMSFYVSDGKVITGFGNRNGDQNTVEMTDIDAILLSSNRNSTVDLTGNVQAMDIQGGFLNDTLIMSDHGDTVHNNAGTMTVTGGAGDDTFDFYGGINTASGGFGDDTFYLAGGTNDVKGEAGTNQFNISGGQNTVWGGEENDTFTVSDGVNALAGGAGDDQFYLDGGTNTVSGGQGSDSFVFSGGSNNASGGDGNDAFHFLGGNNVVSGGAGADTFKLGGGTTTITDFDPGEGDTISIDPAAYGISSHDDLYWFNWNRGGDGNELWLLLANDGSGSNLIASFENWSPEACDFDVNSIRLDNAFVEDMAF